MATSWAMNISNSHSFKPSISYHRALLNFQSYAGLWSVHFINADCKTTIGTKTRYIDLDSLDALRAFVKRCNPDAGERADFEDDVRAWVCGSVFVNLTDEQYCKLDR